MAMRSYQYIKANSIQFWILDKQFLLEIKTAKLVLHFLIKEGLERKRQSSRQKKSWKIMTKVYKIWPNCLDCPTWKVFLLNSSRGVSYKLHLYCPSFMRFDNNNNNVCLILKITLTDAFPFPPRFLSSIPGARSQMAMFFLLKPFKSFENIWIDLKVEQIFISTIDDTQVLTGGE